MIRIEHLSKSFGGVSAVQDFNATIETGSITGLIGPNGAGKTTLFNMLAGQFQPSSGHIYLDNEDVTGLLTHQLFHKGLVRTFQIPHELKSMSTLENLMLVPEDQIGESLWQSWLNWARVVKIEKEVKAKAEEVLEYLNLTHVKHEAAGNLSGGQKKLLELGRSMMVNPKVVLLDEPAAGINRTLMANLSNIILRINQEKKYTFFIIEHDLDIIDQLCSTIIVMTEGKLIMQGNMTEIRANKEISEAYLGYSL